MPPGEDKYVLSRRRVQDRGGLDRVWHTRTPPVPRFLEAASEQPDQNGGNPTLHTIEICGVYIEPMQRPCRAELDNAPVVRWIVAPRLPSAE